MWCSGSIFPHHSLDVCVEGDSELERKERTSHAYRWSENSERGKLAGDPILLLFSLFSLLKERRISYYLSHAFCILRFHIFNFMYITLRHCFNMPLLLLHTWKEGGRKEKEEKAGTTYTIGLPALPHNPNSPPAWGTAHMGDFTLEEPV